MCIISCFLLYWLKWRNNESAAIKLYKSLVKISVFWKPDLITRSRRGNLWFTHWNERTRVYTVSFVHKSVHCSTSIARGHNLKLFKPQCSLDVRKYSFAYRVIDIWNSLSNDIVNASSISVFKHKLESVDFTLCRWSSLRSFIVALFSFVGHASVSFGTCVSRLLFK